MFSREFQNELSYLRELGRAFSAEHPTLVSNFADAGGDPDVDRLLEGFAFLTAKLRQRIDSHAPEVADELAALLAPELLAATPACSIVAFEAKGSAIRGRFTLPMHTELSSREMEGTRCVFRTTAPVDLMPLSLVSEQFAGSPRSPEQQLRFRCGSDEFGPVFDRAGFRLFFGGPFAAAATLFLWWQRHLVSIVYRNEETGQERLLPKETLRFPMSGADAQEMLPRAKGSPPGAGLLREYMTLASRMLFADVTGLDALLGMAAKDFSLTLTFEDPPSLPYAPASEQSAGQYRAGAGRRAPAGRVPHSGTRGVDSSPLLRLFCAPVVNVFKADADPVRRSASDGDHLLRVAGLNPRHAEVFDVRSVVATPSGAVGASRESRGPVSVPAFSEFVQGEGLAWRGDQSAQGRTASKDRFFQLKRRRSPVDDRVDTYLEMNQVDAQRATEREEVVSVELLATNRALPAGLRVGDICEPSKKTPAFVTFSNIDEVTRPVPPPLGRLLVWRLLGQSAANLGSLSSAEALRASLRQYNVFEAHDAQLFRAQEGRISAIRSLEQTAARRYLSGGLVHGVRTLVELDGGAFASEGDAYLFALALSAFLRDRASIGGFHQLAVRLFPNGVHWELPPESGTRALL